MVHLPTSGITWKKHDSTTIFNAIPNKRNKHTPVKIGLVKVKNLHTINVVAYLNSGLTN